jgi:hypothetical protein
VGGHPTHPSNQIRLKAKIHLRAHIRLVIAFQDELALQRAVVFMVNGGGDKDRRPWTIETYEAILKNDDLIAAVGISEAVLQHKLQPIIRHRPSCTWEDTYWVESL